MIPSWVPGSLVPANLLTEVRAADVAATAARAVPGVVRLQPGVWGLLRQFAAQAWTQATGKALPDIRGVDADFSVQHELIRVDLRIVVSIHYQAAHVGEAVDHAVAAAVAGVTGTPARIRVHIVDIDFGPGRSSQPAS